MQEASEPFSNDPWSNVGHSWIPRPELSDLLAWWDAGAAEPVVVEGMAGSGKTMLLRTLGSEVARELHNPDAVHMHSLAWLRSLRLASVPDPEELVSELPSSGRALMLLDETNPFPFEQVVGLVERIRALQPTVGVALTTQGRPEAWPARWRRIVLGPLSQSNLMALLEERAAAAGWNVDRDVLGRLAAAADGSPRTLLMLAQLAASSSVDDALAQLREQLINTVFPRAASPGGSTTPAARELDIRVCAVSDELIRRLAARPELLYELRPRQFEELVAELFEREGFSVELTQQTRDGGVDLYVVQHTLAGSLLTLVDVKRNAHHRPIGVGVVRQLYGVVEAKKANAGLVATTSFFSPDAKRFQEELPFRLELKDYLDLQTMLRRAAGK